MEELKALLSQARMREQELLKENQNLKTANMKQTQQLELLESENSELYKVAYIGTARVPTFPDVGVRKPTLWKPK